MIDIHYLFLTLFSLLEPRDTSNEFLCLFYLADYHHFSNVLHYFNFNLVIVSQPGRLVRMNDLLALLGIRWHPNPLDAVYCYIIYGALSYKARD